MKKLTRALAVSIAGVSAALASMTVVWQSGTTAPSPVLAAPTAELAPAETLDTTTTSNPGTTATTVALPPRTTTAVPEPPAVAPPTPSGSQPAEAHKPILPQSSWGRQYAGLGRSFLNDVTFVDATHGWAVGGWNGLILATDDAGATWRQQHSGTEAELTGVAFADVRRGWAVGFGGTILTTTDGGTTWDPQANPGGDYLAVSFVDRTHGWAVGNCGVISATTDGGRTWTIQAGRPMSPTCSRAALTSVSFADRLSGWVVGGGILLATDDGGQTWAPKPVPANGYYDAFRLDAHHGWLVGYDVVLATTDGGVTWTQGTLPRPGLALLSVTFPTPSTGWAAGIDHADGGSQGVVLASTDGGLTWSESPSAPTSTLRDVAAAGAGKAWAVGSDILVAR